MLGRRHMSDLTSSTCRSFRRFLSEDRPPKITNCLRCSSYACAAARNRAQGAQQVSPAHAAEAPQAAPPRCCGANAATLHCAVQ